MSAIKFITVLLSWSGDESHLVCVSSVEWRLRYYMPVGSSKCYARIYLTISNKTPSFQQTSWHIRGIFSLCTHRYIVYCCNWGKRWILPFKKLMKILFELRRRLFLHYWGGFMGA